MQAPARTSSFRSPRAMTLVRRIHLYSGLVLLPWVLMYGVSALLFNHPALAGNGDDIVHDLDVAEIDAALAQAPSAHDAAAAIVGALQTAHADNTIALAEGSSPRWLGQLRAEGNDGEHELRLSISPVSGRGSVRPREEPAAEAPAGLANPEPVTVDAIEPAAFQPAVDAVVAEHLEQPSGWQVRGVPALSFVLDVDGERWRAEYDPREHALKLVGAGEIPWARAMARLHMTHGYPARLGMPWLHAVIVDVAALAMLFWGISGVMMWWQMRRLRRVGASVLIAALVLASAVVIDELPLLLR